MKKYKKFRTASVILYPDGDDCDKVFELLKSGKTQIEKYAYILHDKDKDKDGNPLKAHFHLIVNVGSKGNQSVNAFAKALELEPYRIEVMRGSFSSNVAYLCHLTGEGSEEKHQYPISSIVSNFAHATVIEKFLKKKSNFSDYDLRTEILTKIKSGNLKSSLDIVNFLGSIGLSDAECLHHVAKHKVLYENAIDIIFDLHTGVNERSCVYISGQSGLGKSTLSRELAQSLGYSSHEIFISTSSSDFLSNLKNHHRVLILEDLRDVDFAQNLRFFLALLDPFYSANIHSRFRNKSSKNIELILINSVQSFDDVICRVKTSSNEDIFQLKRRVPFLIDFLDEDGYRISTIKQFNEIEKTYKPIANNRVKKTPNKRIINNHEIEILSNLLFLPS